jgi:hypothetical protein
MSSYLCSVVGTNERIHPISLVVGSPIQSRRPCIDSRAEGFIPRTSSIDEVLGTLKSYII